MWYLARGSRLEELLDLQRERGIEAVFHNGDFFQAVIPPFPDNEIPWQKE